MTPARTAPRPVLPRPVAIVIVTWNGLDHTRRCLASLLPTVRELPIEVVVVDNGSTDGTPEFLRGLPDIRCILQPDNVGFAAGVNAGIGAAGAATDIVLLNNDVILADPDWLHGLAALAHQRPSVGLVSARLHYPDGRVQDAGSGIVFQPFTPRHFGVFEPDVGQYGAARPVPAVSFACVYLRRELIDRIGLLDAERYFCYYEDLDYCLRAWDAGFSVWCAGDVRVAHVEHASSGQSAVELAARAERIFIARWQSARAPDRNRTVVLQWPEGAEWERRALLRTVALGLEMRGWRVVPRRVQPNGPELPIEELSRESRFDDVWRITAARDAEQVAAVIAMTDGELRVSTRDRAEVWAVGDRGTAGEAGALRVALAPDRDYFRPRPRRAGDGARWLAVLAGSHSEEIWSLLCAEARRLGAVRCVRMEKVPIPYDVAWWPDPLVARAAQRPIEIRRHTWAEAVERAQLYAEVDACVLSAGSDDLGLVALELAAVGVPIAARAEDLPRELRDERCAGLLPNDGAFAAALRERVAAWSRDRDAARRTGHHAALALAGRSWACTLNELSARLEALVA